MAATIDNYTIKIAVEGAEKIQSATAGISGLAQAMLGAGILAFSRSALQLADSINDLSKATGLSIGYIGNLQGALQEAGGSAENAGKMIATFFNKLDDAANGVEDAQRSLGKLGITFNDLGTLSDRALFDKAIQGLAQMEAGSQRTALGMQVFGKSFKDIDPQELERLLATGKFENFAAAAEKAAELNGKIDRTFRNLQIAGIEAINAIIDLFEPFIGKISDTNAEMDKARKAIQLVGLAIITAYGAQMLVGALKFLKFILELNIAMKAQVALQTVLTALQGPKGWLIIAGAAATAAAAIYGVNKAMEAYNGIVKQSDTLPTVAPEEIVSRTPSLYTSQETQARQQALSAAKQTTDELRKQNIAAQQYLKTVIATVGMDKDKAADILRNADIEKEANGKILALRKQIADEVAKSRYVEGFGFKGANEGVIKQYREQIVEVKKNLEETKKLKQEEASRLAILERQREMLKIQLSHIIEQTELTKTFEAQKLKLGEIDGTMTQEQLARKTELTNAEVEYAKKRMSLAVQLQLATTQLERDSVKKQMEYAQENYNVQTMLIQTRHAQEDALRRSSIAGARQAFEQIARSMDPYMIAQQKTNALWQNMSSAIDRFVDDGKFSFSDFAESVIKDLIKIEMKAAAMNLWEIMRGGMGGGGGGGGGGLGGLISTGLSLLGFASGGSPPLDRPSIVGEKGPELFIPRTAGTIVPNNAMGGTPVQNTYVTNNISAIDGASIARLFTQNRQLLLGTIEQAKKELPMSLVRGR
ncbi:MAG: phage tail tape measure C-terminal domain-containing protein [Candidatus Nanopelagicus sp.]